MKESKDFKVQVRISSSERELVDLVRKHDSEMTVSRLFRESLHKYCQDKGLKSSDSKGVGSFQVA